LKAKLPNVETVLGDLSFFEILLEEAKKADFVIQAADCVDLLALESLIKGISQGGRGGSSIHLSGSASTAEAPNGYGAASSRIYEDIRDIAKSLLSTRLIYIGILIKLSYEKERLRV
jgi:hypothetical protein